MARPPDTFPALAATWLLLVMLTLASLALGEWFPAAAWLPLLVAAIVWIKGAVVARHFIEANVAHPFIRRILQAFVAFAPAALVLTSFFAAPLARWTTL